MLSNLVIKYSWNTFVRTATNYINFLLSKNREASKNLFRYQSHIFHLNYCDQIRAEISEVNIKFSQRIQLDLQIQEKN